MKTKNADWWIEHAVEAAVPGEEPFPEGWNVAEHIGEMLRDEPRVLDFGCGWGRMSEHIASGRYMGVDVSAKALERAASLYPEKTFNKLPDLAMGYRAGLVKTPSAVLLYTVLLHVADDELAQFLEEIVALKPERIVIGEIMGKGWRNEPHAYNRDPEEYVAALADGYRLKEMERLPYARYGTEDALAIMDFRQR